MQSAVLLQPYGEFILPRKKKHFKSASCVCVATFGGKTGKCCDKTGEAQDNTLDTRHSHNSYVN